jgi:hypothetical protein
MLFFVTMPLWLGLIIWAVLAMGKTNGTHVGNAKGKKLVSRTVTAPDGKVVTYVVPADEPADVTIARMHAHKKKCPACAEYILLDAKVCKHCGCKDVASPVPVARITRPPAPVAGINPLGLRPD